MIEACQTKQYVAHPQLMINPNLIRSAATLVLTVLTSYVSSYAKIEISIGLCFIRVCHMLIIRI